MRSDNTFLKAVLGLALVGILISGWLLSIHIRFSTGQAGLTESCSIPLIGSSMGCANVAVSDYSDIFGIPLAAIAMGYYFTLVLLVFWAMRNYQAAYEPLYVGFFLSSLAIVVTVIMFAISRFVLKSFCIGCAGLWVVNLLVWPALVKHLNLSWGNALGANLELLRPNNLRLRKERIGYSFVTGVVCLLAFSVIGAAAKGLQKGESRLEETSVLKDYEESVQMFLPAEASGGPTSKGLNDGTPVLDIIEFADFQCPGCKMASQFLKPFVMKHGAKVRLTYRNYPLDGSCNGSVPNGGHRMACDAARAGICAGAQGKFFEMHDLIFDGQENLSPTSFAEFADKIGLDKNQYETCLKDSSTETQLQKDIEWGNQIQLNSTPTIIVNGKKLVGARSPQDFETLLNHLEKGGK